MKSVNRKVLLTLFGVMLAAPFLVIASVVGVHIAALANNVRADMFCVGLALVSVAVRIVDGHVALRGRTEPANSGYVKQDNTHLRGASTISLSY
jgi:hypothetical protein